MHHKYVSMQTRSRLVQHVTVLNSRFALIKCRRASTVCFRIVSMWFLYLLYWFMQIPNVLPQPYKSERNTLINCIDIQIGFE